MIQKICDLKDELIDFMAEEFRTREIRNVNTGEAGQIIDMIKDLAEAEHHCMEACYYATVTEAMKNGKGERYGYYGPNGSGVGSNAPSGYNATGKNQYSNGNGSMGYVDRMGMNRYGYSEESVENIKKMMETADPTRKHQLMQDLEHLMQELQTTI